MIETNSTNDNISPPRARKIEKRDTLHGETRMDEYYWLREKADANVISHLEAENAYADAQMQPTKDFQDALYREMLARIKETDENVPYREGDYFYYSRTIEEQQYPIYCRKRGALKAPEEIILDLNALAGNLQFISLGHAAVSTDARFLAYTLDTTGFRDYTLHLKNLETEEVLAFSVEKVSSLAWALDNETLFYVTDDAAKRPSRLYRHKLGDVSSELVFEEPDELFRLTVSRSRSRAYIYATSASHTTSEVRFISASRPLDSFALVEPRASGHEYYLEDRGEQFYIRTNRGAKNFRLVAAPVSAPQEANWREIVAHRADVMLEDVDCFLDFYVLSELQNGLPKFRITNFAGGAAHELEFPDPAYSVHLEHNREFETKLLRFNYQSFTTPPSVFDYDMQSRERTLLKQTEVLGDFAPSDYQSERISAIASDGTRIPISLVYKKEFVRKRPSPLLLEAYGSYGFPLPITFSSARLSLLKRGMIYAVAHIRGGGELGKEWHEQGRMNRKQNTFTDFIASAEHLIAAHYTSSDKLVIQGGSAGGLLMGAVVNMRPDLFKAVVTRVPFVDVLNTMLDASLPLTVGEYEEWGNPNIKADYEYMRGYSPYDNITAHDYPAMLVKTSLNDSQVMYWEPAKYVARLREMKTDNNLLLLKTNMAAGHGGASGRYDHLREVAFDYAFILDQLGLLKE